MRFFILVLFLLAGPAFAQTVQPEAFGHRLFVGPTAHTLDRGAVQVSAVQLVVPAVEYGMSDRVSLLVATTPLSLFTELGHTAVVGLKGQAFRNEQTAVALGANVLGSLEDSPFAGAHLYAVATHAVANTSLTVSASRFLVYKDESQVGSCPGWGAGQFMPCFHPEPVWRLSRVPTALVQLGAVQRIGRIQVMMENTVAHAWAASDEFVYTPWWGAVMAGVRIPGDRLSVDAGVVAPWRNDRQGFSMSIPGPVPLAPMLSVSYTARR